MFLALFHRMFALILLMLCADFVRAESYMAQFDQAQWQVQRSPLLCRLTHAVPRFGDAIFESAGGGRQRFVLQAKKNPLASGSAQFTAAAPSWNSNRQPVDLGQVDIQNGGQVMQLGAAATVRLLDALQLGLVPMLTRPLQNNESATASIALSPINFRSAYQQFLACKQQLLPVTFDDVKNTTIEFAPSQSELSEAAQKKIDVLLRYVALDHSVAQFEIRGVSSESKRRLDNFELAKQRAQQVSEYLRSRGIDAKLIETSYYGERGPTEQHRAVSIHLKRHVTET